MLSGTLKKEKGSGKGGMKKLGVRKKREGKKRQEKTEFCSLKKMLLFHSIVFERKIRTRL